MAFLDIGMPDMDSYEIGNGCAINKLIAEGR